MELSVANIYAIRASPRPTLSPDIQDIISKLKISFKPVFRKGHDNRHRPSRQSSYADQEANWRERVLVDMARKVREKDDPDYDAVNSLINKITKQTYAKVIGEILLKIDARGPVFRLRITTLLFDRGIRQNFYAPLMADAYADIAKIHPDAKADLMTQVTMFDTLYDMKNVVSVPMSTTDPTYEDALIAWTKQKETKRSFAVYVAELYSRGLIPVDTMNAFVKTIADELKDGIRQVKTLVSEEHVDSLVRFIFAVAAKVSTIKVHVREILAIPRTETPCLNMKSRFKLEDALKL